jgi:hypothetical protein
MSDDVAGLFCDFGKFIFPQKFMVSLVGKTVASFLCGYLQDNLYYYCFAGSVNFI